MADVFKNFNLSIGSTSAVAYTCPAGTTAVILLIQVSNVIDTVPINIGVSWKDSSDSNKETFLIKNTPIPVGSALSVLGGNLILEAGDTINAIAAAASSIALTGSVMEMS